MRFNLGRMLHFRKSYALVQSGSLTWLPRRTTLPGSSRKSEPV